MKLQIYTDEIRNQLDNNPQYREMLFRRGYLLTNRIVSVDAYPFYHNWNITEVGNYRLLVHKEQTFFILKEGSLSIALVGHAYNPFDMKLDETVICSDLMDAYKHSLTAFFDKISELTGLHVVFVVEDSKILACQDACSLTGCYYGQISGKEFISSHPQLIADLCNLRMDSTVRKLIESKCYNIGNRYLPGDLSPYKEVKRLGANTFLCFDTAFTVNRFYPVRPYPEFHTQDEMKQAIQQIGALIHNGIECCIKKWEHCAISLSGGTDSKTTLACANGLYDHLSFYSFHSKPQELVDAEGAKRICDYLGLQHTIYHIPPENDDVPGFLFLKKILQHNTGYFQNISDNEIRKYIYLHDLNAFDTEIKSWASEITRVFFERKYQIKMPEILSERHCSIFQTRYFGSPSLLRWSDLKYYLFLNKIGLQKPLYNYEHADLIYWEMRMGSWGVSVVTGQYFYHNVTMPMNNRRILELMLGMPREERKMDRVHKAIMEEMNPSIIDAAVEIPNLYFHQYRIWMEKLYYLYRTMLYIPIQNRR